MTAPFITIYKKSQFVDAEGKPTGKIVGHIDPLTEKQSQVIIIVDENNNSFDVHKHRYAIVKPQGVPLSELGAYIMETISQYTLE